MAGTPVRAPPTAVAGAAWTSSVGDGQPPFGPSIPPSPPSRSSRPAVADPAPPAPPPSSPPSIPPRSGSAPAAWSRPPLGTVPVGRQHVDDLRQEGREHRQELGDVEPGPGRQLLDRVGPERLRRALPGRLAGSAPSPTHESTASPRPAARSLPSSPSSPPASVGRACGRCPTDRPAATVAGTRASGLPTASRSTMSSIGATSRLEADAGVGDGQPRVDRLRRPSAPVVRRLVVGQSSSPRSGAA